MKIIEGKTRAKAIIQWHDLNYEVIFTAYGVCNPFFDKDGAGEANGYAVAADDIESIKYCGISNIEHFEPNELDSIARECEEQLTSGESERLPSRPVEQPDLSIELIGL